jgi:hypothetical protein
MVQLLLELPSTTLPLEELPLLEDELLRPAELLEPAVELEPSVLLDPLSQNSHGAHVMAPFTEQ